MEGQRKPKGYCPPSPGLSGSLYMAWIFQGSFQVSHSLLVLLDQGSPTPEPWSTIGPWPVTNQATQQEVSSRRASEASSVFIATPHHTHYRWSSASCQHYGELYNYFIIYYNVIVIQVKCTINVMRLNHPQTIPPTPPICGKIVFHKTGPWCQKGWGPLS